MNAYSMVPKASTPSNITAVCPPPSGAAPTRFIDFTSGLYGTGTPGDCGTPQRRRWRRLRASGRPLPSALTEAAHRSGPVGVGRGCTTGVDVVPAREVV